MTDYASIKRMNPSTLVHGIHSMRRLKRVIDDGYQTKSDAMILGSGIHCLLLEPEQFTARFAVVPGFHLDPRNSKSNGEASQSKATSFYKGAVAEFKEKNANKEFIDADQYNTALSAITAIRSHHIAAGIIEDCEKEVVLTGELFGLPMKGRADLVGDVLADVKTTRDAAAFPFGRMFVNLHYGFRMAIYRELVRQTTGRELDVLMIAQETSGDFDTAVYRVPDIVLDNALGQVETIIRRYQSCLESGVWPGVDGGAGVLELVVPQWAMSDELDWSE